MIWMMFLVLLSGIRYQNITLEAVSTPGYRVGYIHDAEGDEQNRRRMMAYADSNAQPVPVTWGKVSNGLQLGIAVNRNAIELHLRNASEKSLDVMSHVATHELHYDWFICQVEGSNGVRRMVSFVDDRNKSAPIQKHLAPGEGLRHTVDLEAWAARKVNGGKPLAPGRYKLTATYKVDRGDNVWQGELTAGPVDLIIP